VLGTTLFLKKNYILSFLKNVRKGVIRGHILKITIDVAGTCNTFSVVISNIFGKIVILL
jgi:hypothetical protein